MSAIRYTRTAALALLIAITSVVRADIGVALKAFVSGDFALAEKQLRSAADNGDSRAQVLLGRVKRDPRNSAPNLAEAHAWFLRAAEAGDAEGQYWAGIAAQRGEGTTKDSAVAANWWRKSAESGYTPAIGLIASAYVTGVGVEKDPTEAVRWAQAGAAKHEMVSQSILGRAYLLGEGGITRNVGQAVHWTRLAAMQGEPNAQLALGRLHLNGVGVPQNYVQAHVWFNLAAARGQSQAAKQRDDLGAKMTAEQLAEAQKLATAWRPVHSALAMRKGGAAGASGTMTRTGAGSGFVVAGDGSILTNHHVVRGCQEVRIPAHGVTASVRAFDERNDLALLQTSITAEGLPTFRGSGTVRLGESIVVAGFPLGEVLSGGLNVTTGSVSALAGPRNNPAILQITAPIQAGSSGGPVLDQWGHVVGVVVSKLNAMRIAALTGDVPQNVNFAVNGAVARSFLETNGIQVEQGVTTTVTAGTVDVAERAKRYTLLIECWR